MRREGNLMRMVFMREEGALGAANVHIRTIEIEWTDYAMLSNSRIKIHDSLKIATG
jgi:hypothetical protein